MPPDSVRIALRRVLADPAYEWVEAPDPWRVIRTELARFWSWLREFQLEHPIGHTFLIAVLGVVLVLLLVHLGYVVWTRFAAPAAAASRKVSVGAPVHDADWHLAAARRLSDAGRYAEALGHRFIALFLGLERRGAVRFHPSKTPAEYLRDAALDQAGRDLLAQLVTAFYGHAFGGIPCTSADWTRFDHTAGELSEHVTPA